MLFVSAACYAVSLPLFFRFMFSLNVENLIKVLIFIVPATAMYVISMKNLTHAKGYNAIQAIMFCRDCIKSGLDTVETCRRKPDKIIEIAKDKEVFKNLQLSDLYEAYQIGYSFYVEKKGQ